MKKFVVLTLGIMFLSLGTMFVKAESISYKKLDNIYFNLNVDGVKSSNGVTMFYLGSRLAYCIEPGVAINTKTYNATNDWSKTSLSKAKQQELEKIGYYGYEYPNHQTDRYYIAAQELIWKAVKNIDIYWTTGPDGTGSKIDVTKEKNEILALIKKHDITPSFTNQTVEGEVSTSISVNDDNKVLNEFTLSTPKLHKVDVKDNVMNITFSNDINEEKITLKRKTYDNQLLLVYTMADSQKLASLRISSPIEYSFTVKSKEKPKEEPKVETKIVKEVEIIKEKEKEVVKVPSTSNLYRTKHFKVLKLLNNDFNRFN